MKLLLIPLFLAGAGAGWYGLGQSGSSETRTDCGDCRMTVECTERGTCIVTCTDANGEVRCREELDCPAPCAASGARPCKG
jgi:hypothetical protein